MIKQTEGNSLASSIKTFGEFFILATWHRIATRMIVCKNDIGSTSEQCLTKNQANVYSRLCYSASADNMMPYKLIFDIKQEHMALLVTEITHSDREVLMYIIRSRETMARSLAFKHQALTQFQCCLYCNSLGRSDTIILLEFVAC